MSLLHIETNLEWNSLPPSHSVHVSEGATIYSAFQFAIDSFFPPVVVPFEIPEDELSISIEESLYIDKFDPATVSEGATIYLAFQFAIDPFFRRLLFL